MAAGDKARALAPLAKNLDLPPGFAAMTPSAKLSALLDLPDPGRTLRRMRADELYYLLASIGLEDAHALIAYASPEQRRAVADFETWSGGRFLPARFDRVIEMALAVSVDVATSLLRDTEPEVLGLHLLKRCAIEIAAEVDDPLPGAFQTPDGVFLVTCEDPDDTPAVRRFLDVLYAVGVEAAHLILHAAMRATPTLFEAEALRFRDARLADLGFPPLDERHAIWEPFDVAALRARLSAAAVPGAPGRPEAHPLALVLDRAGAAPLFWRALAAAQGRPGAAVVVERLLTLVNRVMAARTEDLHEDGAWAAAAAHAIAVLSIGLSDLAGDDADRAADALVRAWPVELYRAGIECLRPLHLAARRVVTDLGGVTRLDLLEADAAEAVRAALAFPPVRREAAGGERREFASLAEVREARAAVSATAAVVRFAVRALGYAPQATGAPARSTFASVFATAWARQVLAGEPSIEPLTGDDVRGLLVAAFSRGRVRPAVRKATAKLADGSPDADRAAVHAFLDRSIDAIEEAVGGLEAGQPVDARFLGDVLLVKA
ncbi:MAG: hypothetical protein FJ087_03905 [Deltaproteobacteria bacterium]|nr:hypothetical protein [Deltaproteobacteria bacterium]